MEDEMDIQPPDKPGIQASDLDKKPTNDPLMENTNDANDSTGGDGSPLPYEDVQVPAPGATAKETALIYSDYLQNVQSFAWQPDEESMAATPTFAAPYITGLPSGNLTQEQLIAGIFINVPRSPKLWVGDQLKMRWGYNTFYTTVAESNGRTGPRLTQYLNSEKLGDYKNGEVDVRYEVVRRSRLVGVSETLKVTLSGDGKGHPRPPNRARAIRRRKLHL